MSTGNRSLLVWAVPSSAGGHRAPPTWAGCWHAADDGGAFSDEAWAAAAATRTEGMWWGPMQVERGGADPPGLSRWEPIDFASARQLATAAVAKIDSDRSSTGFKSFLIFCHSWLSAAAHQSRW